MDINSMMAQYAIDKQADYETQIVKEVWADFPTNGDMSNFTAKDFDVDPNMCDAVYESQGSDSYNKCYTAAISANTPAHNALVVRYIAAQEKGSKQTFEQFKTKTGTMAAIGDLAAGILTSFFGKPKTNTSGNTSGNSRVYVPEPEPPKTGMYIGIGVGVLAVVGVGIYLATRKK